MKIVKEDLWKNGDLYVVTTNGKLRSNGSLVMGRGAAYQATQFVPSIDMEVGRALKKFGTKNGCYLYGFLQIRPKFGVFQVKYSWDDEADLGLIKMSVTALTAFAGAHPELKIRMNYPGIGNGRLKREDVEPLLAPLPDNVTICTR